MIVDMANRCLFTLITKNREWKDFEPTLLLYLFDHLSSPVLSYGCDIWGNRRWDEIEKIHLFICKYALGVKNLLMVMMAFMQSWVMSHYLLPLKYKLLNLLLDLGVLPGGGT